MDYHLLGGVNKRLCQTSISVLCSLNKYNNCLKFTYLYKIPIIRIKYDMIEKMPKKYKYIIINIRNNEEIDKANNYGINIIGLVIECYNNCDVFLDKLPTKLKYLRIIGVNFDKSLDNLPKRLKLLTINGCVFDKPLNNLPPLLKVLVIYSNFFDKQMDKLPKRLKSLTVIGDCFNKSVDNLPQTLKTLRINGKYFNQMMDNLPQSLKSAIINYEVVV